MHLFFNFSKTNIWASFIMFENFTCTITFFTSHHIYWGIWFSFAELSQIRYTCCTLRTSSFLKITVWLQSAGFYFLFFWYFPSAVKVMKVRNEEASFYNLIMFKCLYSHLNYFPSRIFNSGWAGWVANGWVTFFSQSTPPPPPPIGGPVNIYLNSSSFSLSSLCF